MPEKREKSATLAGAEMKQTFFCGVFTSERGYATIKAHDTNIVIPKRFFHRLALEEYYQNINRH